jgi:Pectate lyase superfamily protein
MAIVQISRITNRKGLIENLPQLAGAELGWAVDTRQLFIGNGTLQEGAPVIGNTEILTEFSDITAVSNYTYKDIAVGYAAQTGPTASDPVVRTVQAKLDDFADVRDFGAVGDGAADDTAAINRALFQLYCVEANTQIRRTLYFPAGTYKITETIIVPAYAKLVGEGANCTTIYLDTSSDISSLSAYVARYGDSLQQTGVNIGNNGATAPTNIEISSMTFQTAEVTDVFLVEDATQCYFDSVNFVGPLTAADIIATPSADNIAGVRFASTVSLVCNQITFDKCRFQGLTYGINTDQEINSVTVSNGAFVTLYQGISLGTGAPVNGGATGFRAVQNLFDEIYSEGIIYDNVDLNVSAYNVFYDVGNQYSSSPATPVVLFGSDNNVSISDMFERDDVDARIEPRVEVTGSATTTGTQIQVGHYARENGRIFTLTDNQSNQTIFTTDTSTIKAYEMTYTIIRDTVVRFGTLVVTAGSVSPAVSYADEYTEDASSGITLSVTRSGDVVSVLYSSTSTGLSGTITYSLARLA